MCWAGSRASQMRTCMARDGRIPAVSEWRVIRPETKALHEVQHASSVLAAIIGNRLRSNDQAIQSLRKQGRHRLVMAVPVSTQSAIPSDTHGESVWSYPPSGVRDLDVLGLGNTRCHEQP